MPVVKEVTKVDNQDIEIYVEIEHEPELPEYDPYSDTRDAKEKLTEAIKTVDGVFDSGLQLARNTARKTWDFLKLLKEEGTNPDEFEVQFSVKLDGGVPALVQAGGHLQVTMKWKDKQD